MENPTPLPPPHDFSQGLLLREPLRTNLTSAAIETPISLHPNHDPGHRVSPRPDLAPPAVDNLSSIPPNHDSAHPLSPGDPIRPDVPRAAMGNLISLVHKLQLVRAAIDDRSEKCALPTDWDALPSIVVVGRQGSGKSSVLESVVGKDFLPKGSGIVTRRPLVLQLHGIDGTGEYAEFLHQPGRRFTDFAEVRKEIADETDRETGRSKAISSVPIHLSIFSPNVVNLTLIDLPGLTKIAVDGQSDSIVQDIDNMVRAFIEKPNCIILAVSPANQDLSTSDAMNISREVDPKGERTFGVLTKIDLMDKGTDAVDILEGRSYRLQFPWFGVVNRSQQDINENMDMIAGRRRERDYFANTPEYNQLAHRMGSEHLAKSLSKHLESVIRARIPGGYMFSHSSINSTVTKKNRLQGYTLKVHGTFPVYQLRPEGVPHCMTFGCTVDVQGRKFMSAKCHVRRKDAEEDAANMACTELIGNETLETLLCLVDKDELCKINLLKEYILKKKLIDPSSANVVYGSSKVAVESQMTLWLSTVMLDGHTYIGDVAKTKRLSIQSAASEAVRSMIDDGNDLMVKLVLGKRLKIEAKGRHALGVRNEVSDKKKQILAELEG